MTASVSKVTSDVVALLAPQKTMKGIEVEQDIDAKHTVRITESRLVQVLLNLGMNAGDAMGEKGGRLRFESNDRGDAIVISVSDTGPGIAEDVRENLFEPFVTTKEPGEGTGLGLAVCRGIIESAGGTIKVDAEYKDGAKFVITLPRA